MSIAVITEQAVTNADKTFFQLRSDIVEGDIPAGSKLSETELSTKYQVSRAVIREAINRLEACHLVLGCRSAKRMQSSESSYSVSMHLSSWKT